MIIGSGFPEKYKKILACICRLAKGKSSPTISVKELNREFDLDRTEMKNVLEYLENLGFIRLNTIGGPLLYGHISATKKGMEKCSEMHDNNGC